MSVGSPSMVFGVRPLCDFRAFGIGLQSHLPAVATGLRLHYIPCQAVAIMSLHCMLYLHVDIPNTGVKVSSCHCESSHENAQCS